MQYKAKASTYYEYGTLNIKRKGYMIWEGLQLGSGFDVEIVYDKLVSVDGAFIGINDEYDLTPALARFLAQNHALIHSRVGEIEASLAGYRQFCRKECMEKAEILTYGFLTRVYDHPRDPEALAQDAVEHERNLRVRQLLVGNEAALSITYRAPGCCVDDGTRDVVVYLLGLSGLVLSFFHLVHSDLVFLG
jgi:hypothetical protein